MDQIKMDEHEDDSKSVIPKNKMMDLLKESLRNSSSLSIAEILKYIAEVEEQKKRTVLPRLLDTIKTAEENGIIYPIGNYKYALTGSVTSFCGTCGGKKRRRSRRSGKSKCPKKRRRRRSRSCKKKRRRRKRSRSCKKRKRRRDCGKKRCKKYKRKKKKKKCRKKRKRKKSCIRRCKARNTADTDVKVDEAEKTLDVTTTSPE